MPRRHPGAVPAARRGGQATLNRGDVNGQSDPCKVEETMEPSQDLALRQKQEVATKEERTVPGRYYAPVTDIYETDGLAACFVEPGHHRVNPDGQVVRGGWPNSDSSLRGNPA